MSQVGRISGPLLTANLERNGIDLKISNTVSSSPVLKFDVINNRIGIVKDSPIADLDIADVGTAEWEQQQKFTPSDSTPYQGYGYSLDISGEYAVVAERNRDVGSNNNQGKVYIYKRTGSDWTELQQLTASDGLANDAFGGAVAISGNTLVVTAQGVDIGGQSGVGAVYVYTRDGDTWTQQGSRITADTPISNRSWGVSVDISGDTIVVGAEGISSGSGGDIGKQGSAYVFTRSGNTWTQQQILESPTPANREYFGHDVGISGDTIVVGAYYRDKGAIVQAGSGFVFSRSGSTWTQLQELTADDPGQPFQFGEQVSINGNYIAVSAPRWGPGIAGQFNRGAVYVYYKSGTTFTQQQKITADDPDNNDNFGESLDISGDLIVAGSRANDLGAGAYSGTAYVLRRSGSTWAITNKFAPTDLQSYDDFGNNVAVDDNSFVMTASGSPSGTFIGAVYAFAFSNPDNVLNTTNLIATGTVNVADFTLANQEINVASGDVIVNSGSLIEASAVATDDIKIEENNIYGTDTQANILLNPKDYTYTIGDSQDAYLNAHNTGVLKASQGISSNPLYAFYKTVLPSGFERADFNQDGQTDIDDVMGHLSVINGFTTSGGTYDRVIAALNAGLSKTDIQSDLDVDENLHATGNITFGGTITLGSGTEDDITFAADVASDIVPDVDNTYIFGRDTGLDSTTQRLGDTTVDQITATTAIGDAVIINGVNYALAVGNSFFVAVDGDDTNRGDHPQGAFKTIKHALSAVDSSAGGPTTIHIAAGTYTEEFPLTVPTQTNIAGAGFREVIVKPTVSTQDKDCFLLTGETTVSNLTVMDYFYNSSNDTGYGFRFANNAITSTRSPYIQNVSVITKGSVTSSSDPRGFDQGDAGRGALVDGSVLDSNSTQASMLFHSVTFITPGAIGLRMKDGVRVEWLNSFTYFADVGIKAENGSTGFVSPHDGSTRNYGAEIRSIGSANVYGNQGAVADGGDCLMYLIQHNMAYIGTGRNKENDKTLRIEANETVELNSGKIYFQTTDAQGKFKVGDNFFADFDTGNTSIDANTVAFDSLSEIRINTGSDTTFIDGTRIDTGNILLSGNRISSSTGNLVLDAITKHDMRSDVSMNGKLDITGNFSIGQTLTRIGDEVTDTVNFNVDLDQDLKPGSGGIRSLGSTSKRWQNVFVSEANIDDIRIFDNVITTTASNTDLEFVANSTGNILLSDNNLQVDNNLEAGKLIVPTLTYTGNLTQTGDIFTKEKTITGTVSVDTLNVARDAFLKQIDIVGGNITNTVTNSDLKLNAIGTGKVRVPGNNVLINNDISVGSYQVGGNIFFTGDVDSNVYSTDNIRIFQNNIETTQSNSDLELRGTGTGSVLVENLFFKNRTITSGPPGVTNGKINFAPGSGILNLSGTGSIQFPKGNIAQRRNETGDVRFNSQLSVFEGFSTGTVTFGGIFSDDQQTSVQVHPTNNHLDFSVDGSLAGTINIAQVEMPGLQTDDILIDGKKITTNVSNSDLELTPNGTGTVNIIGNTINLSSLSSGIIKNDSTGALTISATDEGYHKIGGTFGVRIPTGDNSNRDAGDSVANQIGDTRYNTQEKYMETWDGSVWQVSAGGGGETISAETMENLILEFTLVLG